MYKDTSLVLGEHFDQFIEEQIGEGRYQSADEVVRAGLRLLETESQKFNALKKAIQEGIDSGIAVSFDPDEHLQQLKKQRALNG